jgi:hypothetical protein
LLAIPYSHGRASGARRVVAAPLVERDQERLRRQIVGPALTEPAGDEAVDLGVVAVEHRREHVGPPPRSLDQHGVGLALRLWLRLDHHSVFTDRRESVHAVILARSRARRVRSHYEALNTQNSDCFRARARVGGVREQRDDRGRGQRRRAACGDERAVRARGRPGPGQHSHARADGDRRPGHPDARSDRNRDPNADADANGQSD